MQRSSEVKGFGERALELEASRDFLLQLIRHKINDYPLRDRAIFELSYYSPISSLELIGLDKLDIDIENRTARLKRGSDTLYIPITDRCTTLLNELCTSANLIDTPLFLK